MNREIIKAVLPVLEAYSDNKIIQSDYGNGWKDIKTLTSACIGDCLVKGCCRLRIKPKPEYIPFTFEDHLLFKDKWFVYKESGILCKIVAVEKDRVYFTGNQYTYIDLFSLFLFEDGSPCGKLKQ